MLLPVPKKLFLLSFAGMGALHPWTSMKSLAFQRQGVETHCSHALYLLSQKVMHPHHDHVLHLDL
jgi:hypothetical protein